MDTSKEYIKMCEKAEEIQKNYIPKHGDFVCFNGMTDLEDMVVCSGDEFQGNDLRPWCDYPVVRGKENTVWLPRQDQLQGLVDKGLLPALMVSFGYFVLESNKAYTSQFSSFEQLWLVFVMKEKYNKIWNGEEWVIK